MALTVPGAAQAFAFDATLIDQDDWILSAAAQSGSQAAWGMLRDFGATPQFTALARTTDNTAASSAMDLTTLGLTFKAGGFRTLRFKSRAVGDDRSFEQTWEQTVWGNDGTTPKLLGTARLLDARGEIAGTAVRYGSVKYHGTTSGATVTDGADSDSGLSLGNFSGGIATLTVPTSRNTTTGMRVESVHFSEDAGTLADTRLVQVRAATATTFTVNLTNNTGAEALSDPTGVNNIDIGVFLLPPPSIALVMSSNNVQVHVGFNGTDNIYHDIQVFVSRQDLRLHSTD